MSQSDNKAVNEFSLDLENVGEAFKAKLALPSVGVDFGSYHVRVAVVQRKDGKVALRLATFKISELEHALQAASETVRDVENLQVFYTGHSTEERVKRLQELFPKAKEVQRRDKLDCHNAGATFLISSCEQEDKLFYDTSGIAARTVQTAGKNMEVMMKLFPPKMLEMLQQQMQDVIASQDKKLPIILSIVGANNIVCHIDETGTYKPIDARCSAGHAMMTLWNLIGHPGHTGNYEHFIDLATKGDRRKIDSVTNEILEFVGFYSMMPRDMPIFTFGKMENLSRDDVTPEDLARATLAMNTDLLFSKAMDFGRLLRTYKLYYTGHLVHLEFVRNEIMERFFAWGGMGLINPKFLKTDATAALGACLA